MSDEIDYEAWADAAERGELHVILGTEKRGEDAAASGRAAIFAATGAATVEEANRMTMGRPKVGEARGESRQWNVRASEELRRAAEERAAAEHISVSDLVRKAVAEYVSRAS